MSSRPCWIPEEEAAPPVGATIDGFLIGKGQAGAATDLLGGFLGTAKKPARKK